MHTIAAPARHLAAPLTTPRTLGILGGMGPLATANFFGAVVRATPAESDQGHLPTLVWSDGRVPDRTEALLGRGPSPLPMLVAGAQTLADSGADVLAIPCNTAHAYLADLAMAIDVPIIDMVRETVSAARRLSPDVGALGILSTSGTRIAKLYDTAAAELGLVAVHIPWDQQDSLVDEAIRIVKGGGRHELAERLLGRAAESLQRLGADVCVTACTELPLIAARVVQVLPVLDSVECLAHAAVRRCLAATTTEQTVRGGPRD